MSLHSEFPVVMSVSISALKRCSVRLYFQLFVGGFMYYIRYLCLFAYSDVPHILCCVFVLFIYVLSTLLSVSLDCPLLFAFRYSLTFIYIQYIDQKKKIKTITIDDKMLQIIKK